MKINILQKLVIFSFIVLASNGIIGYAVFKSNQKRIDADKLVRRAEYVILESENILSLGKDIESSSRGFVITNDSTFLEPLFIAKKMIFTKIVQLRQFTQDNQKQQQQIDSLKFYIQKRLDFSLQTIELREKQGLASAIFYISSKQGKIYSDQMRQIVTNIQQEENNLLTQRKKTNEDSITLYNRLSVFMFITMIVFTVLLLIVTGKNLIQNKEKTKRADELIIANKELLYQNEEKEKRAAELIIANRELIYQNEEKEKRAAELVIADKELEFQNKEKGKRADELIIANRELIYQKEEKEKRAEELFMADKELEFQNEEKGKRADELIIANRELVYQNEEKEKRAEELVIADKELEFQNLEKWKRAEELIIVNKELAFQNEENEKQEAANKELEAFSYSVSHDLRAPLRHIGGFVDLLIKNNSSQLDTSGLRYLKIISESSNEMGNLIDALLSFSRLSRTEIKKTKINSKDLVSYLLKTFSDELEGRNVEINVSELPDVLGDQDLIKQVWVNLISNALKYTKNKEKAIINISSKRKNDKIIFRIEDNGAGFDMKYADKLFGVFQRLHKAREFEGIGIGLANVNRIVVRHGGTCHAQGEVDKGATFFFSLPIN